MDEDGEAREAAVKRSRNELSGGAEVNRAVVKSERVAEQ